ncbi:MAG: hypothetical protein ABEJ58_07765 [Halodesulfurarchaeum sp.]
MTRGQTTLDFLIGTSVFLLAVFGVVLVVPGLVDPFATGMEGQAVTADRVATTLATDDLAGPETPFTLNDTATQHFFTSSEADVRDRLGIADDVHVNVTLTDYGGGMRTVGPTPPEHASVTTSWRLVYYKNETADLTVRVWS